MRLRNPPIIESWIEFQTDGSETENTWTPTNVDQFFSEIRGDYPTLETLRHDVFQVAERSPEGVPVLVNLRAEHRFRAFDAARQHCVQLAMNKLVTNVIKTSSYPGFRSLLPKALSHLDRFSRLFRPSRLPRVALHATDIVRFPRPASRFRLEDFFNIGVQVPQDDMWILGYVGVELSIALSPSDELIVSFRREPPEPNSTEERFRIDWHAICTELEGSWHEAITARLKNANVQMKQRFRECFTAQTWELFAEETSDAHD